MKIVVGVSDLKVSTRPNEMIITYALGSCLGVSMYDPNVQVGGLLHVMLPLSKADPEKAKVKPAMYVDTGLKLLLNKVYDAGAKRENIEISVAGGASMGKKGSDDYFKIGKRNFTVLRKILWKNQFMIKNQDIGGHKARTMSLRMLDGQVTINKKQIKANQI